MTLGATIAHYRKEFGLSQEALAGQLGVTNQAVSKWESDHSCPDITLLPQLADIFGISLDMLFGRNSVSASTLPWADDGALRAVIYVGHTLVDGHKAAENIRFCYTGPALDIHSQFSVVCDDVQGNIYASGSVTCDEVSGNINAGGNVTCDCIDGNVQAGGNINCDEISGDVQAGGSIYCDHFGE